MHEFYRYEKYLNNNIAYDIGSHIGEIAILMKKKLCDVYAFEPSINNFPTLVNRCSPLGINCYQVAFHEYSFECFTQFKDCKTDYIDKDGNKIDTFQHIQYDTLENFIKNQKIPYPDFIKMDIEGMESLVLKTMNFLFQTTRPVVYVEIHAAPRGNIVQNYKDNPHWIWPEDGGFDFNTLKNFNYRMINEDDICISLDEDYNPYDGKHGFYILIPGEKI